MIKKKYRKLCIKKITGSIQESEEQLLVSWLSESNENNIEFEKLKKVWSLSVQIDLPETVDTDLEWARLNEKLKIIENNTNVKSSILKRFSPAQDFFIPKLKPILVSALALFIVAIGIYIFNKSEPKPELNIVATTNNEQKSIQLPDGSTVHLNSSSSIEFLSLNDGARKLFNGEERKVALKGEAFFSVTKNNHPFIITTANAKITVLGTKFDVLSRDKNTRVVVKEGKVKFSQKSNSRGINLSKDQLSIINKNSVPTKPKVVDSGYFLGWMNGNMVFYRTHLDEIAADLNRRFHVNISLSNESLKDFTLTGSFKNSDADSTLSMICLALGLDYEKQNNRYIIKEKSFVR